MKIIFKTSLICRRLEFFVNYSFTYFILLSDFFKDLFVSVVSMRKFKAS